MKPPRDVADSVPSGRNAREIHRARVPCLGPIPLPLEWIRWQSNATSLLTRMHARPIDPIPGDQQATNRLPQERALASRARIAAAENRARNGADSIAREILSHKRHES